MTTTARTSPSTRAWATAWRTCAWGVAVHVVLATVLSLATGFGLAVSGLGVWTLLVAALCAPAAALLAALLGRLPLVVQVVAFSVAGGLLGAVASGSLAGSGGAAHWLDGAVAAGLGRWLAAHLGGRDEGSVLAAPAVTTTGGTGPELDATPSPSPVAGDAARPRWESPLAWVVAVLGGVVVFWSGYFGLSDVVSPFAAGPTENDRAVAAQWFWVGAGAALVVTVAVALLAARVRARGEELRGGSGLPVLGGLVAVVLALGALVA